MNFGQSLGDIMPYSRVSQLAKADRNRGKYKPVYITQEHHDRILAKARQEVCTKAHVGECLIQQFLNSI
jgi:hypothetical protein